MRNDENVPIHFMFYDKKDGLIENDAGLKPDEKNGLIENDAGLV